MPSERLNIAIIGTRGIPGNYGGFETFAERLSVGLVEKGHQVTVYCPSDYSKTGERYFKGVRRLVVPNVSLRYVDKLSNSLISCVLSTKADFNIILFLGVSPVLFAWLPRLFGKKTIINIDGLEWKRRKWNRIAAAYLKLSEALSGRFCHEVVTDSRAIQDYFKNEYGKESTYIAYGADIGAVEDEAVLSKYGLKRREYFLQVCRLEPENNSHIIIREFCRSKLDIPLVILGDAPHAEDYINNLKAMANEKVKFLGSIYGYDYTVIRSNCYCYIHAHEVGGTNPALLEALAAGNCVVVLDVPYNLEVIGDAGLSFDARDGDLSQRLRELAGNPQLVSGLRCKSVERIRAHYRWGRIVEQYEELFLRVLES